MTIFRFKLPLFWKFSIAIITIVLIFGSINSILIYNNVQSALRSENKKRALFIARSIASQITSAVLFEDYISLQNTINNVKEIDENIFYIFITDNKRNVLVHTFSTDFPSDLVDANPLPKNQTSHTQLLLLKDLDKEVILDVAVPILDGKIGNVRVGLRESSIIADVQKTINIFWIMVAVFLAIGITGALVFSNFITKPIKKIQNTADNIDLQQLEIKGNTPSIIIREKIFDKLKMWFRAEDEIDILAEKFNDMILRLNITYKDLQTTQTNLIQSEKLASVGTLTAGLAHEINNPVAGLQNCIRRIKNDPANIEQNEKYLVMMETATNKIEAVVKNLLEFTRKQEIKYCSLDIEELIENSLMLVSHRLEKLRISVTKTIDKNLKKVSGDKNQLEQVLLNLFINSIDSIEEKILLQPESDRRLIITSSNSNKNIEVLIEDTGNGIPENQKDKIFDPFYTTKAPGKGTGLGLSIVYKIIDSHNGKISLQSIVGKGTTFILQFPIIKQ